MIYTRIRLDFIEGPKDRFYRTVLVKGNPDLYELGIYLGLDLSAEFEHCFLITMPDKVSYVMASFMKEPHDGYKHLRNYHLSDLPEDFRNEYDIGHGWCFACKKDSDPVELEARKENIIIVDGRGQGILEDNISSLHTLFNGEIDLNSTEEDETTGAYMPWNFPTKKFRDFDLPLILKNKNKKLKKANRIYKEFPVQEIEYVEQRHVWLEENKEKYET